MQIQPQIMENLKMGSKRKSKKQTRINCKHFDKLYVLFFFFMHHLLLVLTFFTFLTMYKIQ